MPTPPRPAHLSVTALEDRLVPALFGVTWPDPQNLSVSFAPDGTDVGGMKNTLSATLNAVASKDVWQGELRRALQTWAAATNIDVHVVSDFGGGFGEQAQLQGNWKYGDIRIAARPLSTPTVAVANPPDLISGWAGEIILNSNYQFSVGGGNGTYDLYSVVLHEAGHALGLSHDTTPNPADVMYEDYTGVRAGLSAGDVAAIQKLYGVRTPDAYEGSNGNGTTDRATAVNYLTASATDNYVGAAAVASVVRADLTSVADADVYKVQVPTDAKSPFVLLTTSNVSQLAAAVTVTDKTGAVLKSASASSPGTDLSLDLSGLAAGQTYYVKVQSARTDAFGVGGYRLTVGEKLAVLTVAFTSVFSTNGETLETNAKFSGIDFGKVRNNPDARWDATGRSQLTSAADTEVLRLTAASSSAALVAAVWTTGDVSPNLRVTNALGVPVAFDVLRADRFATVVQVRNVTKGATYNITLSTANWKQPSWLGPVGYRFAADFRASPIDLTTFASGTLSALNPTAARTIAVTQSQLFRFELTAGSLLPQPNATATLTVQDSTGKEVFRLTSAPGQTVAADVFLAPGSYTVRVTTATTSGLLLPLTVRGRMTALTDPIGPTLVDPLAPAPAMLAPTIAPPPPSIAPPPVDLGFFWGALLVDPLGLFR